MGGENKINKINSNALSQINGFIISGYNKSCFKNMDLC